MTNESAKKLRKGNRIYYAGGIYDFATLKEFPHGIMIGIYDEPPTKHIDYLQPKNVDIIYHCPGCTGIWCPVCGGCGKIIGN